MDTLAFGYILPTTGRIPDLHRLETCAAGRTAKARQDGPAGLYLHIFRHFGENALLLFFTAAGIPIGKGGIRSGHGFRPRSGLRPGNGFRPYISTGTGRSYRTLRTGSSTAAAVALAAEGIIVLAAAGIVILASVLMSSAASAIVVLAAGIT